jgi:hypothetical protein
VCLCLFSAFLEPWQFVFKHFVDTILKELQLEVSVRGMLSCLSASVTFVFVPKHAVELALTSRALEV